MRGFESSSRPFARLVVLHELEKLRVRNVAVAAHVNLVHEVCKLPVAKLDVHAVQRILEVLGLQDAVAAPVQLLIQQGRT